MKFQTLKIENFLTIGSIKCRLDNKGLVLIQGQNEDDSSQSSNGAGKSSFSDALSWCLYGATARGVTGDDVINRTAKKDCMVSVDVLDDQTTYRIIRHRKHSKEKNRLLLLRLDETTGDIHDQTKGTDKLTQELVDKLIGCSVDVFNAAIYSGQEKTPDLPAMTDKQLKTLVEEAAGIDRLQQAEVESRNRLRDLKSDFALQNGELINACRALSGREQDLIQARAAAKQSDEQTQQDIKRLVTDAKQTKAEYEKLLTEIKATEPESEQIGKELQAIYQRIDAVDAEKAKLKALNNALSEVEGELASQKAMTSHQAKLAEKAKHLCEQVEERVGTPCGQCGKPYEKADLATAKALASQNFKQEKDKGQMLLADAKKLAVRVQETRSERDKFESSMTDISVEVKRSEALRTRQNELDTLTGKKIQFERTLKDLMERINALKARPNPHQASIERLTKQVVECQAEKDQAEAQINNLTDRMRVLEQVAQVFGPAGVRAYILDTVTPFLNHRTAHYLSILTDGNIQATWQTLSQTKKGELREKFAIDVNSSVGAASFGGLSGGEKRKVRLACSMALQDLVASRATKPVELFIADEIDHALDESGLERLMLILDEKAKDRGTVLVISHTDLSDWIRQQVTVRKETGKSVLLGGALA